MTDADRVPGGVKGLAAVSLMNDVASEMVYPLLPAFVTVTLGGSLVALGAIDGAAECTASLLRWWSGRHADRPGRRPILVLVGYTIAVITRPVMALTSAAWQVVGVRVIDRVGKGIRSPARDAMIADLVPRHMLGRAFGLHRSADHLGAVLGSLLGFWLLRRGLSVRAVLGLSWIPGAVAMVILIVTLRMYGSGMGAPAPAAPAPADRVPAEPSGQASLRLLAALAALRLPETLLLFRLQQLGAPIVAIPLLWALLHVVKSAASYPAGLVADRLGVRPALVVGTLLNGGLIAGFGLVQAPLIGMALFLGYGVVAGIGEPAERAAVARLAPTKRGAAFGTYQALTGAGSLIAGIGFGWLYQEQTAAVALPVAAIAGLLVLSAWLAVDSRSPG